MTPHNGLIRLDLVHVRKASVTVHVATPGEWLPMAHSPGGRSDGLPDRQSAVRHHLP